VYYCEKKEGKKVVDFGTKNLMDHATNCSSSDSKTRKQMAMTAFINRQKKTLVSKSEQAKLRENEAKFIGGCQLPFNVVDNEHFRTFCQNLIDKGAKYGSVGASDVLVGRKSVRSDILKMANLVKMLSKANCINQWLRELSQ